MSKNHLDSSGFHGVERKYVIIGMSVTGNLCCHRTVELEVLGVEPRTRCFKKPLMWGCLTGSQKIPVSIVSH